MFEDNLFEIITVVTLLIWAIITVSKSLYRQMAVGEYDEKCKNCGLNQVRQIKDNR